VRALTTSTPAKTQDRRSPGGRVLAIYSGRTCLGLIREIADGRYEAINSGRQLPKSLGFFETAPDAANALEAAAPRKPAGAS
jgi:hypothetical protein